MSRTKAELERFLELRDAECRDLKTQLINATNELQALRPLQNVAQELREQVDGMHKQIEGHREASLALAEKVTDFANQIKILELEKRALTLYASAIESKGKIKP